MAERAWSRILVGVLVLTAVAGASSALAGPAAAVVPAAVTAAVSGASRGWYRLRVQIGGRRLTFSVSAGGDIQAG